MGGEVMKVREACIPTFEGVWSYIDVVSTGHVARATRRDAMWCDLTQSVQR